MCFDLLNTARLKQRDPASDRRQGHFLWQSELWLFCSQIILSLPIIPIQPVWPLPLPPHPPPTHPPKKKQKKRVTPTEKEKKKPKGTRSVVLFYFPFYICIVPMGFLPWEIRVAFPGKSQLRQSRANKPTVHAGCFSVSIIHRTLT